MTVKLTIDTKQFEATMAQAVKLPDSIVQDAYDHFVAITPRKTGNAQNNTKLQKNTIVADYSYAEVLDKGRVITSKGARGSEKAPRGMSVPTVEYIQQKADEHVKKIGNK